MSIAGPLSPKTRTVPTGTLAQRDSESSMIRRSTHHKNILIKDENNVVDQPT